MFLMLLKIPGTNAFVSDEQYKKAPPPTLLEL